jgi:hypothetical protein
MQWLSSVFSNARSVSVEGEILANKRDQLIWCSLARAINHATTHARAGTSDGIRARDGNIKAVHAVPARDSSFDAVKVLGGFTCAVRIYDSDYVPTCARGDNEEAIPCFVSNGGDKLKLNKEAVRAHVATTVPPTLNPTAYPIFLPTKKTKALDVPIWIK